MRHVSFHGVDDAAFDLATARIVDDVFTLDGVVEFRGFEQPFRYGRHAIRLRIWNALAFQFDVAVAPFELRRRFRWVPLEEHGE